MTLESKSNSNDTPNPSTEGRPVEEVRETATLYLYYNLVTGETTVRTADSLSQNKSLTWHAEAFGNELRRRNPNLIVCADNPVFSAGGASICFTLSHRERPSPQLPIAGVLADLVRDVLRRLEVATQLLLCGHQALEKSNRENLPPPRIKAASAKQKEVAVIASDASLRVAVGDGIQRVKACRQVLKAAEAVNACGLKVSARFLKEEIFFPLLPPGASKADWIAQGSREEVGQVTGILRHRRMVEVLIDKNTHELAICQDDVELYVRSFQTQSRVRMKLQVALPGNPFHSDGEKLAIEETLQVLDGADQHELQMPAQDGGQTDA